MRTDSEESSGQEDMAVTDELLLSGGAVRVPLADGQAAEALLIRDGRVLAVGAQGPVSAQAGAEAERLDVGGGCVLPAFRDAHVHLSSLGMFLSQLDLSGADSLAEALQLIAEVARRLGPGEWLRGGRWNRNRWADGQPTKEALDRIVPDNPVALPSHDGHSIWVNSLALRLAGVTKDTPSPPGGTIWRNADGEPTGILSDAASGLVRQLVPEPSDAQVKAALADAIQHALRFGVVRVRNCQGLREHRLLRELGAEGRLPLSVASSIRPGELEEVAGVLARRSPGDSVLVQNLKLFADGALGSQTALMLEPYEDPNLGVGLEVTPPDVLRERVAKASELGLPVAVHAIGDRAVRQALNAIEKAGQPGLSYSVEHAQLIQPDDLPRFARLRVTASVQPSHLLTDVPICEKHWGQRSRFAFSIGSLLRSGARVVFGSDAPVEPIDPRRSLFAAVVRRTLAGYPEGGWYAGERVSMQTALACHTVPVDVGSRADLVVLARDPLAEPAEGILDNRVLMTIVEGQVVYRAE